MNKLIILVLFCFSQFSLASTYKTIYADGYSANVCSGSNFNACSSALKNDAKSQAQRKASNDCSVQGGFLNSPNGFCSDYCNPSFATPDQGSIYTSCRVNCQFTCLIQ